MTNDMEALLIVIGFIVVMGIFIAKVKRERDQITGDSNRGAKKEQAMTDSPITFRESSYALFDVKENAVRTTQFGNLAIFSVRAVAEQWAARCGDDVKVVEVSIYPTSGKH